MNLWARRAGLMIMSALTFFSCEEELSTVGLPPENDLGIFFVDVPLKDKVSQIWIDEISSRATGSILTGSYQDPYFGYIEARNYSELRLPTPNPGENFSSTAVLDSLVIDTRFRNTYGTNIEFTTNTIEIYQLTDTLDIQNQTYTLSSSETLGAKLAEKSFSIFPDSVNLDWIDTVVDPDRPSPSDTLRLETEYDENRKYIYKAHFRVDDAFAQTFFNDIKSQSTAFSSGSEFGAYFGGIAFIPSAMNSAIITFGATDTQMTLYYSETDSEGNVSQETLTFPASSSLSYNSIIPNKNQGWSGSDFDELNSFYEAYTVSSDYAYLQSGTNLLMKIDLSSLKQFADTVDNPVIQKAELIMSNITDISDYAPPPTSMVYYLTSEDSLANDNYRVDILRDNSGESIIVNYDSDNNELRNDITLSTQSLLYVENLNQLILTPVRTLNNVLFPTSNTVNRLVVPKDDMRLRFYYSIPEKN